MSDGGGGRWISGVAGRDGDDPAPFDTRLLYGIVASSNVDDLDDKLGREFAADSLTDSPLHRGSIE